MFKIRHIVVILILCTVIFSSCKEKPEGKETNLTISLSGESVIPNEGGSMWLQIETDPTNEWMVKIEPMSATWITINPMTGTGTSSARITIQPNTQQGERYATISVTVGETQRTLDLSQKAAETIVYEVPFRLELPMVRDSSWYIQHDIGMYALEYDTGQRHPIWVAYVLNQTLLTGSINRNNFTFDPKIPKELQPHEVDNYGEFVIPRYWTMSGNTYERGHILANADRPFSQAANDQTNFMSNISPHLPEFHNSQGGTGSGAGVWLRLEGLVRDWAKNCDTLYIVKGGSIIPDAPGTEIVEVLYNINRTVVPRYYFKTLVARRGDMFEGIAFWLEQRKGMERRAIRRSDAITIRELEQKTGINFFHNLKYVSPGLEEQVETSQPNWTWWTGVN